VNFVFTAMRRNIHELPDLVSLAADLGLPEVKVVYLTVFKQSLRQDSLLGQQELIREVFAAAQERAQALNINLKLPEIQGECEAGTRRHKPCAFPWRDLYIGSDEYLRPCQSSAQKIVHISEHQDFRALWNCEQMQELRRRVNDDDSMSEHCHNCYHSTCANWNLPHTFIHSDHLFAPEWTTDKNTSTARG
jgi:MoaA/NifB/PqqE/SkfB family radical SAM enzyme